MSQHNLLTGGYVMRSLSLILLLTVAISVAVPVCNLHVYGGSGGDTQVRITENRVSFTLTTSFPLGVGCGWGTGIVGHQDSAGAGVNHPDASVSDNESLDRDMLEFALYLAAIEAGAYPTGKVIMSEQAINKLKELLRDEEMDDELHDSTQSGSPPANTRQEYPGVSFRVDQINKDTKKFTGVKGNERIILIERTLPNGTTLIEREHQPIELPLPGQIEHIKQWPDVYDRDIENLTYQRGGESVHIMKWENGQTVTAVRFPDRVEYTYVYSESYRRKFNNKPVKEVMEIRNRGSSSYSQTITYTDGTKDTRQSKNPFGTHPISFQNQMETIKNKR
jgi:hypothetical protein